MGESEGERFGSDGRGRAVGAAAGGDLIFPAAVAALTRELFGSDGRGPSTSRSSVRSCTMS